MAGNIPAAGRTRVHRTSPIQCIIHTKFGRANLKHGKRLLYLSGYLLHAVHSRSFVSPNGIARPHRLDHMRVRSSAGPYVALVVHRPIVTSKFNSFAEWKPRIHRVLPGEIRLPTEHIPTKPRLRDRGQPLSHRPTRKLKTVQLAKCLLKIVTGVRPLSHRVATWP